jgi:hypothetical protein
MLKYTVCTGALALAAIAATVPPQPPQAGVIREADHTLRPLYGLPANLIAGPPLPGGNVLSASFSNEAGLVLTPGALKLVNLRGAELASYQTDDQQAVLSISGAPNSAIAWLPGEGKLVRWTGSKFQQTPVDETALAGQITDVQIVDAKTAELIVKNEGGDLERFQVSLPKGDLTRIRTYTGISGPALLRGASLLFQDPSGIKVQASDGSVKPLPSPESAVEFERSASDWVHATSTTTHHEWMIHLDRSHPTLSEIPAVQPLQMPKEGQQ